MSDHGFGNRLVGLLKLEQNLPRGVPANYGLLTYTYIYKIIIVTFIIHPPGTVTITMNWISLRLLLPSAGNNKQAKPFFIFMLFISEVYILVLFKSIAFNQNPFLFQHLQSIHSKTCDNFRCDRDFTHKHLPLGSLWDRYLYFKTSYKWSVHLQTSVRHGENP